MATTSMLCFLLAAAVIPVLGWQEQGSLSTPSQGSDPGFDIEKVVVQAYNATSRSWEYGALAEALLELYNPKLTVFAKDPFPQGRLPEVRHDDEVPALRFVKPLIWTNDTDLLIGGEGSSVDPASLGVPALLLGQGDDKFSRAASRQADYLFNHSTRYPLNSTYSAISHRDEPPQLWGDFIYMVPPFFAYYGAATQNIQYIAESVLQIQLYHDVLATNITVPDGGQCFGLWQHIATEPTDLCCTDPWVWLTSNSWTYAGIARVLATIMKWQPLGVDSQAESVFRQKQSEWKNALIDVAAEMLKCHIIVSPDEPTQLLKNYIDGEKHPSAEYAFGDAAGTALTTAAVYRLAVLVPEIFATREILAWADANRVAVARHVSADGVVVPVADVGHVPCRNAVARTSEGQSMVILMYSAYRDFVAAEVCHQERGASETTFQSSMPRPLRLHGEL